MIKWTLINWLSIHWLLIDQLFLSDPLGLDVHYVPSHYLRILLGISQQLPHTSV